MWWLACSAPTLDPTFTPGDWTPAAGRVSWRGPAGRATLEVDDGPDGAWRVVAEGDVADGDASLPLALVPAGTWRMRVSVDGEVGRERPLHLPEPEGLAPSTLGAVDARSELAQGGYWVGHQFGFRWNPQDAVPFVLDGRGRVVWWAPPDPDGGLAMRVEPGLDGRSIVVMVDFEDGAQRALYRYALDGGSRVTTPAPGGSHDFAETADGFTYIGYERSTTELVPGEPAPTAADVLVSVPEGGGEPVLGFSYFDDFPRDPWYTCDHAAFGGFVPDAAEWTHTNTVIADAEGFVISPRQLDAVLLVDGHERRWQVGGLDATLPGPVLRHPHLSEVWRDDDGVLHLLVFDNGNHTPEPIVSRVVEIAVDGDGAAEIWELPDPEGRFTNFLGGANRLPGGDTLVAWSPRGELAEYTPAGEVVWSWTLEATLGRGVWVAALTP